MSTEHINQELVNIAKELISVGKEYSDAITQHTINTSKIIIQGYEDDISRKAKFIADLEKDMPPKFLKSIRKEWQQKIDDTYEEIKIIKDKLYHEYENLGRIYREMQENNA